MSAQTHAPPEDARRIRLAAHTAGTCLTPVEQMRVRARFLGVGKVLPLPSVFVKPKLEPHTYTDLTAWMRRVAMIAVAASRQPRGSRPAARPRQARRVSSAGARAAPDSSSRPAASWTAPLDAAVASFERAFGRQS